LIREICMSIFLRPLRHFAIVGIIVSTALFASCAQDKRTAPESASQDSKIAPLAAKEAYLLDREEIREVYLRYISGFDRKDVELMRSAFWPDVQINYGSQSNSFDEFVTRHLDEHMKIYAHYGHLITNESIDVKDDVAHVESYVTRFSTERDGKAQIVMGRYV